MDELEGALNEIKNAMGAAVEFTAFLFNLLLEKGFTREEALAISKEYLLGMIKGGEKDDS